MKQGQVFRVDKGDTLQDTLTQAIVRYREKFRSEPITCYVHPDTEKIPCTLRVVKNTKVAPNHLWLELPEEM